MRYAVVILARGGSERIPGKNIKLMCGKPLLAHTILYAQTHIPAAGIWVSTDSEAIKEVALKYGAKVIDRPAQLCDAYALSSAGLQHAALYLRDTGVEYDYMIQLQATNPLRPDTLIDRVSDIAENSNPPAIIGFSPIVKKMGNIIDGEFIPRNYSFGGRSQDMDPEYYENGQIHVVRRDIVESGEIFAKGFVPLIVDHLYASIDIDTLDDFIAAEIYMKLRDAKTNHGV